MALATDSLAANLASLRSRIAAAARRAGRAPEEVLLVAVTKSVGPEAARALLGLGVADLGESRVQALEAKAAALGPGPRWHLVGTLQRNKARRAAAVAALVHSLDGLPLLDALDRIGRERGSPVRALVEVNVAGEASKRGIPPDALPSFLEAAAGRAGIAVEGLMAMAPLAADPREARPVFRRLRELGDAAARAGTLGPGARLSMGMSSDFEVAVEEGSTIVRVGTALFEGAAPHR